MPASWLSCSGCGATVPENEPYPFRCPAAVDGDGVDHVLVRRLTPTRAGLEAAPAAHENPFVRYRERLHSYHRARQRGWSDARFVELVERLDEQIARVDGRGFRTTPLVCAEALAERLGRGWTGKIWVKDETGNVAGSHKARHLMGILLHLLVAEAQDGAAPRRPLAIASCGNAALAAAVLARAAAWPLDVYVPPGAQARVLQRLEQLGARLVTCPRRKGERGDPCYLRFREAMDRGALPFTCQGPENGLAIEGGETLAYELIGTLLARSEQLDRLVVQVGGGALASACVQALLEAREAGLLGRLPRIHAVQTRSAYPLAVAWQRLVEQPGGARAPEAFEALLRHAARHRGEFMQPWPTEPASVAHGILDDETYDWLAVARGLLESGGSVLVVGEQELIEANALARETTGITVDATGSAGLSGLLALASSGALAPHERAAVLFTGLDREACSGAGPA